MSKQNKTKTNPPSRAYPKLTSEEQRIVALKVRSYGINKFLNDLPIKIPYKTTPWGTITRANLHRVYSGLGGISPILAKALYDFFDADESLSFLPQYSTKLSEEDLQKNFPLGKRQVAVCLNSAYAILYDSAVEKLRTHYLTLPDDKKREVIGKLELMMVETAEVKNG